MHNILLDTDSYKQVHYTQYPPGTEYVYSYMESRGGKYQSTVFFGLQYILLRYLQGVVVTKEKIKEAETLVDLHFGSPKFNKKGWEYILKQHGGVLPVRIKAVPEGTEVPVGNVLMTIENTDPKVPWLTNFLETCLMRTWYPLTVATQSNEFKKLWLNYLKLTGTPELVDFKLHDFGCRGVSSYEQAGIGGLAHLLSFKGTDTLPALICGQKYYAEPCAGYSVPANEHSTVTSWGVNREVEAYESLLDHNPSGIVSCVSDSYNIHDAVSKIFGQILKDKILKRDGVFVVRPDSGTPEVMVLDVLRRLDEAFGSYPNSRGYKVLNDKVRVIQGDGIDFPTAQLILKTMTKAGYSADNLTMGSGGALLQKLDRDTQKCAIKASSVIVNGEQRDVFKDPVSDHGKRSKRGRLKLVKGDKGLETAQESDSRDDVLWPVFENGKVLHADTLYTCRQRLEASRIQRI